MANRITKEQLRKAVDLANDTFGFPREAYQDARDGKLWMPDSAAIRAALPFRYRAAFDRNCGVFWYDKRGTDYAATMHLYSSRNKPLMTLYLQPLKG